MKTVIVVGFLLALTQACSKKKDDTDANIESPKSNEELVPEIPQEENKVIEIAPGSSEIATKVEEKDGSAVEEKGTETETPVATTFKVFSVDEVSCESGTKVPKFHDLGNYLTANNPVFDQLVIETGIDTSAKYWSIHNGKALIWYMSESQKVLSIAAFDGKQLSSTYYNGKDLSHTFENMKAHVFCIPDDAAAADQTQAQSSL